MAKHCLRYIDEFHAAANEGFMSSPPDSYHPWLPCYITETLSESEMQSLCDAMQRYLEEQGFFYCYDFISESNDPIGYFAAAQFWERLQEAGLSEEHKRQCELAAGLARGIIIQRERSAEEAASSDAAEHTEPVARKPRWDAETRTLYLGSEICKRYRQPAGNQTRILAALEEDGWPETIDDPLPGGDGVDPVERRRDAVKALNESLRRFGLRFEVLGEKIVWSLSDPAEAS